ncbi:hypothetical protein [Halosimplex halophilum]|uniref:hypothetical protein n=1 Tax=Halosimplex halophilum TaxID=2559572 RepID=UPI00107F5733|nr:hypothetical protein [Halosimplex halophilum]
MSFTIPSNRSLFLVTYVDGEVASTYFRADIGEEVVTADGYPLDLRRSYSGTRAVQTVVYSDRNGNGEFDRDADGPCLVDGSVVQAGPERLNFTAYGGTE